MAVLATVGLQRIAQLTIDDTAWVAVGTGTGAEAVANTTLTTETDRKVASQVIRDGAKFQIRCVFPNADLPSTTEEIGWFLNASGTANSGSLLVRVLHNFVKGSQDLLVILDGELQEN